MIEFACDKCGQKLQMPDKDIGKKCRCPECKAILIVPEPVLFEFCSEAAKQSPHPHICDDEKKIAQSIQSELDLKPKSLSEQNTPPGEESQWGQYTQKPMDAEEQKEKVKAPKPAILEIFLYPMNANGLSIIAVIVGIPFLINVLTILAGPFGFFVAIPGFVVMLIIAAYAFWYFGHCIIESAEGQTTAPDVLVDAPSIGDMGWQCLQLAICIGFFIAPPLIYYKFNGKTDIYLYLLLSYTAIFLPMGLLAVVLHDSLTALNPILLLRSILKTFFSYIKLVILFYIFGCLFFFVSSISLYFPFDVVIDALSIYLLIVLAGLLGRYYWKNREKLDWDT